MIQLHHLHAIKLNNNAIPLIESGNFMAAGDILSKALIPAQTVLDSMSSTNDSQSRPPVNISLDECMVMAASSWRTQYYQQQQQHPQQRRSSTNIQSYHYRIQQRRRQQQQQQYGSINGENDDEFIYRKPIHLPTMLHEQSDNYEACVITSTAIIFNLALVYHLSALQIRSHDNGNNKNNTRNSTGSHLKLKRSIKLYKLAFGLQHKAQLKSTAIVFTMAAINNMGLIYRLLNDTMLAGKCFDQLLTTLLLAIDSCDVPGRDFSTSATLYEFYAGFFQNTQHYQQLSHHSFTPSHNHRQNSAAAA